MKNACSLYWLKRGALVLFTVGRLGVAASDLLQPPPAEVTFSELETATAAYQDVTVLSQTRTAVYIRHASGVGNVLVADLDDEAKYRLGYAERPSEPAPVVAESSEGGEAETPVTFSAAEESPPQFKGLPFDFSQGFPVAGVGMTVLLVVFAVSLLLHLLMAWILSLVCRKAGSEPGIMIWIPFLQVFPLLRAAGMSHLWVLAGLVPVLNIVASILWCVNIVNARGKPGWWAILMILPITNIIALLYLAFSDGEVTPEGRGVPIMAPGAA